MNGRWLFLGYKSLSYALLLFAPFYLLWRARRNPAYRQAVSERFGGPPPGDPVLSPIWVHAVSVGETVAAIPLVRSLQCAYPQAPILFTTMTPTGRERAVQALGGSVQHCFLPYDAGWCVRRFLARHCPRVGIVMETELWPNLFSECAKRSIPIVLANARLSERSVRGYRRVRPLINMVLNCLVGAAAQSEADAERLVQLGLSRDKIQVTGSVKFDLSLPASLHEQAASLRRRFGSSRSVFIAASTHDGEERIVLDAFAEVREVISDALLIIVPRHPERFSSVLSLCRKHNVSVCTRSENRADCRDIAIFLGDSMGELALFYAASDIAFVGGSLVAKGGHNMLEPAALGLPVLVGPHVFNFADISEQLIGAGAARQVSDRASLVKAALELLRDANLRSQIGDQGREFIERNRGALKRVLAMVDLHL